MKTILYAFCAAVVVSGILGYLVGIQTEQRDASSAIQVAFHERANGDYRLSLTAADRALVCEEKDVTIVQQPDAVHPLILECSHLKGEK